MIKFLLLVAVVGVVIFSSGPPAGADEPPKKGDDSAGKIAGTWKVVSAEQDGKAVEGFKDAKWVFTQTTLAAKFPGEGDAEFAFETRKADKLGTIDLEVTKSPRDGGPRKRVYAGIYTIEGDTLKICFATSGKDRPKELATKKDSGHTLVVLKR